MTEIVLRATTTELEADALAAYLESVGCHVTVRRRALLAFPSVSAPPGTVAEVLVAEEDEARARGHLGDYDATTLDPDELTAQALSAPAPARASVMPTILSARSLALRAAIVASFVFNLYAVFILYVDPYLGGELAFYDEDENLQSVTRTHRGSVFPYETELYDRAGRLAAMHWDRNEDGWAELSQYPTLATLDSASVYTDCVMHDANQDGIVERQTVMQEARVLTTLDDTDRDGLLDTITHEATGTELTDADGDGFPERLACRDGSSPTALLELAACPGSRIMRCVTGDLEVWRVPSMESVRKPYVRRAMFWREFK